MLNLLAKTVVLLLSAAACVGLAVLVAGWIEQRSLSAVAIALDDDGQAWVEPRADGLRVILAGVAPDEAARFRALSVAGDIVDGARVVDRMTVAPPEDVRAPDYRVEILRNDADMSLIGLVPSREVRDALREETRRIAGSVLFKDLLEIAEGTPPEAWEDAARFGLEAVASLPRSKTSITADRVSISALADSDEEKRRIEASLSRAAPSGVALELDIDAPRPVIAPFTVRFVVDGQGPRFDACAAASEEGAASILRAAAAHGAAGPLDCTLGLGSPSPSWDDAVTAGIEAVADLGGGSVTFSDVDVTLVAPEGTDPSAFDAAAGGLEAALPPVFALHAVLPEAPAADDDGASDGPARLVATRGEDGKVEIRGRLAEAVDREVVESFAQARFGAAEATAGLRLDDEVPATWTPRVLAGLDALGHIARGSVVVTPDDVTVQGETGEPEARRDIARLLSEQLGGGASFTIDVSYTQDLDPKAGLPSAEECVRMVQAADAERKITFAPSSAEFDPASTETLDRIAEILRECGPVPMEIAGYTDSQGREEMNLALSQQRADAVLDALISRRILTSGIDAIGYGEADPIADNDTEAGREANRRIEFHLVETATAREEPILGPH
jgi:OOP family OmpA-OmpF porin